MPKLLIKDDEYIVKSDSFVVSYKKRNEHFFTIQFATFRQDFYIPSSCDSFDKKDLCFEQINFQSELKPGFIRFIYNCESTLWKKIFYLDIYDSHVEFYYDLFGKHSISNLHYFEGIREHGFKEHFFTKHFNDHKITPYREYSTASPVNFKNIFNPEPNVYGKQYFEYFDYSQISVNSDFIDYCGGNFLFNPGILCFLISNNSSKEWISLGLAVKPNEYLFSEFEYIGGVRFGLNINYCGLMQVNDYFRSPKIFICSEKTEEKVLQKYIQLLKKDNLIPQAKRYIHDWWKGPIISAVGHQYYQTDLFRIRSPKERPKDLAGYFMCNQVNYEYFISLIDKYHLDWRILIIDVKWFINAGLKEIDIGRWPDMKGFVSKLHKRGKKVLIWWGPWDTEGWDINECITYADNERGNNQNRSGRFSKFDDVSNGIKIAPDITLSSVKNKVKEQLERILGGHKGGIDIDGLKLDHTADTPGIYGLKFPEGSQKLYGIEMLRYYYKFLYETVKKIKPDALIVGQSPNPYFIDCIDMIRLGDTYCHTQDSVVPQMSFRHKMVKLVDPTWPIDMDGWPMPSLKALHEYSEFQVQHGVPSLYYATHIDTTGEEIPIAEWKHIRKIWDGYRQRLK